MNQKGGIMKDYVSDCLVRDLANRDPRIRQVLEQLGIGMPPVKPICKCKCPASPIWI